MITLPYKFVLVVPFASLRDGVFKWHRFYEQGTDESAFHSETQVARYGTMLQGKITTYRLDVHHDYFRPDETHWSRSSLRDKVHGVFRHANVRRVPKDHVIVMVWTNEDRWINEPLVPPVMESWDGRAGDARSLWGLASGLRTWAD